MRRGLSSNVLKIFACICMLIDHTGLVLCGNNQVMRSVGRLAFPVFAFLIAEGVRHTSDIRRYMSRMAVLALVSEVPFDLAICGSVYDMQSQNVFFTLLMGLFAVTALSSHRRMTADSPAEMTRLEYFLGRHRAETVILTLAAAEILRFDYGAAGVAVIILFYVFTPLGGSIAPALCLTALDGIIYLVAFGSRELYALLSIIPIAMYSGERGRLRLKYAFYLFYPLHLLIIWAVR